MAQLARYLEAEGWRTYSCDLVPSWGQEGMDVLAGQLQAFVAERLPAGEPFDLVGYSMGGLVGRYYLQRLDGLKRVRRFVTIATPHRGSLLAYAYGNPGFRQMRPGSEFLRDLDRDVNRLAPTGFTSLWTPLDLIVLPARSSVVPTARCRKVWALGHPFMVWQRHCHRAVAESLGETAP